MADPSEAANKQAAETHKAHVEALKKQEHEQREAREKVQNEQRANLAKGKPTPTQEENDRARMGEQVKLAEDGSGPDPHSPEGLAQAKKK